MMLNKNKISYKEKDETNRLKKFFIDINKKIIKIYNSELSDKEKISIIKQKSKKVQIVCEFCNLSNSYNLKVYRNGKILGFINYDINNFSNEINLNVFLTKKNIQFINFSFLEYILTEKNYKPCLVKNILSEIKKVEKNLSNKENTFLEEILLKSFFDYIKGIIKDMEDDYIVNINLDNNQIFNEIIFLTNLEKKLSLFKENNIIFDFKKNNNKINIQVKPKIFSLVRDIEKLLLKMNLKYEIEINGDDIIFLLNDKEMLGILDFKVRQTISFPENTKGQLFFGSRKRNKKKEKFINYIYKFSTGERIIIKDNFKIY